MRQHRSVSRRRKCFQVRVGGLLHFLALLLDVFSVILCLVLQVFPVEGMAEEAPELVCFVLLFVVRRVGQGDVFFAGELFETAQIFPVILDHLFAEMLDAGILALPFSHFTQLDLCHQSFRGFLEILAVFCTEASGESRQG
jgi:hypothetical protein